MRHAVVLAQEASHRDDDGEERTAPVAVDVGRANDERTDGMDAAERRLAVTSAEQPEASLDGSNVWTYTGHLTQHYDYCIDGDGYNMRSEEIAGLAGTWLLASHQSFSEACSAGEHRAEPTNLIKTCRKTMFQSKTQSMQLRATKV